MAKTKISEFSTTAGNNTDINSINIAEGCAPSGINDAIRELMRQLKEFQTGGAGDSVNSGGDFSVATNKFTVASASGNTSVAGTLGVTGTTTLTGALVANGNATLGDASGDTVTIKGTPTLEVNPTLSGGTANGVLYLNGSKVATSGSALTFDGTYFTVGASATTGDYKTFIQKAGGELLGLNASSGTLTRIAFGNATASFGSTQIIANASDLAFITNSAEAMRLTSTGLGVGISSPATKLHIQADSSVTDLFRLQDTRSGFARTWTVGPGVGADGVFAIRDSTAGANRLAIDSSGNLGLGVTPSASSACVNMELSSYGATLSARNTSSAPQFAFMSNAVGNWYAPTYKINGKAAMYLAQGNDGSHSWYTAGTGTAGDAITFTQAMTLDADGDLGVGTTSPAFRLDVLASGATTWARIGNGGSNNGAGLILGGSSTTKNWVIANQYNVSGGLEFTQTTANGGSTISSTPSMLLDSSGNLLVGTTSSGVADTNSVTIERASSYSYVVVNHSNTSNGDKYAYFGYNGSTVGSITQNGVSQVLYNISSDQRLKENIANADSASALIDALQVRQFDWKADGSHQRYGFIAQELVTVAPEAVHQPTDPEEMMALDYSKLVPMLVKEIQSLRARVASLES